MKVKAEGEKQTRILQAEAKKAELIAKAEGENQAIELINKAQPNASYITLQGFEALKVLANRQAHAYTTNIFAKRAVAGEA